ncbi:OLC1v1013709C1 [Oldenlandia corymbosa var. corymbosa]|uniref:OLC1v1013709C1 n=1 Tax=Oldenlandia corymbosa var. corymbosa TaxID=529605 RepID=A0AAV1DZ32_OLDCO|nr:OLC1v1013709C1 [Oldenlandia corymbosa var. corymbosa]
MVRSIEIKSDGDVFHEIFRDRPHHISTMSPTYIQGVDLHDGDWGKVGSVIFWNYTHGKLNSAIIFLRDAILLQLVKLELRNVIEGDLMELYKSFVLTVHVDTVEKNNLVTWTLEYEKKNESVPDPESLMEFCLQVTKDIETHHLN